MKRDKFKMTTLEKFMKINIKHGFVEIVNLDEE